MPNGKKYVFTASARAEVLSELYGVFWGNYSHLFLPNNNSSLPMHATLSEVQSKLKFCGAGEPEPVVPGMSCGHIFKKGESCFRCKDCALDDSCVLCARCFHASNHADHNVSFFIAQQSGGSCDCGDVEAWRNPIDCPHHPPAPGAREALEAAVQQAIRSTPRVVPRTILASDVLPVQDYPHRVTVPHELRESMSRAIAFALDYVLDTLDYSPEETRVSKTESDLRTQATADPMVKDTYTLIVWNDDKHAFAEVTDLIVDLTGLPRDDAYQMTCRIDEIGREVIDMGSNGAHLLEMAKKIAMVDLGVTVRRAHDTFREHISSVMIEWLLDLTRCRIGTDAIYLRELIAEQLLSPRSRETLSYSSSGPLTAVADAVNPSRLTWLFLFHTKLWKRPRLNLKEIYVSVLNLSHDHKLAVASHFAHVYHRVIDAYLLVDREAETSIKYFALQLFTVPSVALHIVKHHNVVARLLNVIVAFFTNQIQDKRIVMNPRWNADLDVEASPFKSKRFMPVFSDLRYLCHNEPVQQLIAHNESFIRMFSSTCQLFMCINPNKRAATNHVEYETDAWISVFNVTLSLSRVIKVYGEAFGRATTAELVAAIDTVIHHILSVCTLTNDRLDRSKFTPIAFHDVEFGGAPYHIVNFDVLEGWVSFHHSLHWLLAELFKHVDILSDENLREVGCRTLRELLLQKASERALLTMVDFPLRVLAMIAQIRTGLWVRNGFAIRGQLLHYRDFMLRELCYDQDLFILQTALVILDPSLVFVTILDRFQLLHYFSGATIHPFYEGPQLMGMVEEVLYVLITILSEKAAPSKLPTPVAIRREIVHALAVGPCTFTDLVKRVAERMVEDISFERVLKEVADFKPPEGLTDSGLYELKDEVFDEVTPFFYHYTRNKREEVETILKNRLKKKGIQNPVIVPQPLDINHGPFTVLKHAFESEALLQIIFYALHNIVEMTKSSGASPPSSEAILDQGLHLIMLALVERPVVFSNLAFAKTFEQKTLLEVVCSMEHDKAYVPYKDRVVWILDQFDQHVPAAIRLHRKVIAPAQTGPDAEDEKKRAAKARQEAIMRQMKAQQASFAHNFDDVDDDDEEDESTSVEQPESYGTCIVCQEDLNSAKAFGLLGLLQPSRLIRRHPDGQHTYFYEALQTAPSLDRSRQTANDTMFPPPDADARDAKNRQNLSFDGFPSQSTRFGVYGSICNHMMHLECFQTYSASIRSRHRAQPTRNHPENIPRKEYICPLCKSLGNVIIPLSLPTDATLSEVPFSDWVRASGISILKSKPDPQLDALQFRNGTGEFVFWAAQDVGYPQYSRTHDRWENVELHRMVDTVMVITRTLSQQTRHLRDRLEPQDGERGVGLYLPEELVGYTIASLEVAQRGCGSPGSTVADSLTDAQTRCIGGLLRCLVKLTALQFKGRADEGKDAVRQAIIKRLLPEWSRSSLTPFSSPLLLRDPFTLLVETAAVAPDMLRHVLVLTYYACLARTVIGLVYFCSKTRNLNGSVGAYTSHEDIFGDVRIFFMSVARHSPVFEHNATLAFQTFGESRLEKLLYSFTLPFLRRAAILCRAVLPSAYPTPTFEGEEPSEYRRLLVMLGIPPLSDLPKQDTLQNCLSGWCAHYGHSQVASQFNFGVTLEYPTIYRIAQLPLILDNLFGDHEKVMTCTRCKAVPADAAICLICGTVVCLQSHCCWDLDAKRGECNIHTRECGGAIGLYFLVKRCSVLYLYAGSGAFQSPPYLDVHGEVDVSMRRGRRQYLHHARWEDIRKNWITNGIPTLVARKLEATVDNGGWEAL
ncbi:hypothetical protein GLOTRDRAFT_113648 [Gloeophyllum trabeum ATCC 11539]|uniref:E3 ubiquitin-protein ligase n=1 Tax=Gloeophyllum trabeum (strain ATCC 11539 / FP-39264 / Madison 617) TaxID=670483 RepID=S7S5H9_GLOTA|nr:uncharacterized protein GLOTRDRAFT_113648 [Gloeophyllum trabeum ATCC 11539]EPQ61239.1 hypothetical protein GLOTRDRAFT_113648 [Gloeophyllum trabeum ATCC 11539]